MKNTTISDDHKKLLWIYAQIYLISANKILRGKWYYIFKFF